MSSLEMVEYINEQRKQDALAAGSTFPSKGFAKLEHADFLKKVPEVLGVCAGNFSGTYQVTGPKGGTRSAPCYTFPKREACLMAMSYSYEIQAKVFDRMTVLESNLALPVVSAGDLQQLAKAQLGGIMKSVLQKAIQDTLHSVLPAMIHGELAKRQLSLRHGVTAGQVWARHGLPKLKNGPQMLSRKLIELKCGIEGGGRAEIGGKTAKLFDPDKADAMMKSLLLAHCQRYVQERESQIAINFDHHRKTEAKIKEIVTSMAGL